jgi:hypothetical protein
LGLCSQMKNNASGRFGAGCVVVKSQRAELRFPATAACLYRTCGFRSALRSVRRDVDHPVVDRLQLLLEQILEDELTPNAAACVRQGAALVELSQLDGCEPQLFGQCCHGIDRVLVIAR